MNCFSGPDICGWYRHCSYWTVGIRLIIVNVVLWGGGGHTPSICVMFVIITFMFVKDIVFFALLIILLNYQNVSNPIHCLFF